MIRFLYLLILFTNLTLAKSNEYQLGPGDEIEIFVYQESELKTLTKLSQSGQVDLPLVGQVKLEGLSIQQAKTVIEKRYEDGYLLSPDITIMVRSYRPFFIHGEVKSPGSYKYQAEINLEQAIALAGGLKDRASNSHWVIWRGFPRESFTAEKSSQILPGDVIKINKSFF